MADWPDRDATPRCPHPGLDLRPQRGPVRPGGATTPRPPRRLGLGPNHQPVHRLTTHGTDAEERNGLQQPRVLRAGTGRIYRQPEAHTITTNTHPGGTTSVPVGPGLSMFDPMFIGIEELGHHLTPDTVYPNLLM